MGNGVKNSAKIIGSKATKRKTFTREDKLRAVMLYHDCGNLAAVAKKVGVSRTALNTWVHEYQNIRDSIPEVAEACIQAITDASHIRQEFLSKHYNAISQVIGKGLQRATVLIDKADNLGSVVNALEKLSTIIKDFTPTDNNDGNGIQVNLLQQTIKQIKNE